MFVFSFIATGALVGCLAVWVFQCSGELFSINTVASLLFATIAVLSIYQGVKCLSNTSVQLVLTGAGLSYRDVRKSITSRNKRGIDIGFYLIKNFNFLAYENIEKAKVSKLSFQGPIITIVTKSGGDFILPILIDKMRDLDEIAKLINEKSGAFNKA